MMTRITLKNDELAMVHELIASGQKIKAIKIVRDSGRLLSDDSTMSPGKLGLREAKLAVDNISGTPTPAAFKLVSDWHVHSVTVTGPAGEKIELDLENLQMHFLTTLTTVGLEEVGRLLGLVKFIKQWQGDALPSAELVPAEEETK
jgi:hypothetical protein